MKREGLEGKVALVTGAASKRGMGHAIALRLAGEGADIAVLDVVRSPRSLFAGDAEWRGLDEVVENVEALGRRGLALMADISDKEQTAEAVAAVVQKLGRIDVLVHCAAIRGTVDVDVADGDPDEWKRMFDVNVLGSFLIAKQVVGHMVRQGDGGKIVMIASLAGRQGIKGSAAYAASKWAVIGLVQSLAKETAPHRINVNAICPGMIITNLRDDWVETEAKRAGMTSDEFREIEYERGGKVVPLGRMGEAEDIARVATFLASRDSDYMTGQSLNVCGGLGMN